MKFYIAYLASNTSIFINHDKKYIVIGKGSGSPGFIYNKTFVGAITSFKESIKEKEFYVSQCTLPLDTDDLYNIISAAISGMIGDTFPSIRFEIIETHKISKEE